jgi:hypothetical protein
MEPIDWFSAFPVSEKSSISRFSLLRREESGLFGLPELVVTKLLNPVWRPSFFEAVAPRLWLHFPKDMVPWTK